MAKKKAKAVKKPNKKPVSSMVLMTRGDRERMVKPAKVDWHIKTGWKLTKGT